ncbi:MAG TPA: ribbon-helix-helix protein, CopG family [Candidatus Micrarchaeaceae archaeon]|nr:ribbon-helix-helix protein, CopG family [Candidatus Micrarchaeaceae archaeon]
MLVRKQILVPAALDKKIRRLAQKRGISQSALIVAAVEALLDASGQIDHLTPFIGVIKGASPRLSESVDDIYR